MKRFLSIDLSLEKIEKALKLIGHIINKPENELITLLAQKTGMQTCEVRKLLYTLKEQNRIYFITTTDKIKVFTQAGMSYRSKLAHAERFYQDELNRCIKQVIKARTVDECILLNTKCDKLIVKLNAVGDALNRTRKTWKLKCSPVQSQPLPLGLHIWN